MWINTAPKLDDIFLYSDIDCPWFVFSSTGDIQSNYSSVLGVYKKQICSDETKILYQNEESGSYLLKSNDIQSDDWKVWIYCSMKMCLRDRLEYV